jgi:hypothetical protein
VSLAEPEEEEHEGRAPITGTELADGDAGYAAHTRRVFDRVE